MTHYSLDEAEDVQFGVTEIRRKVKVGDTVQVSEQWVATISQAGLDCDCGKGILCPENKQHKVGEPDRDWLETLAQAVPGSGPGAFQHPASYWTPAGYLRVEGDG